MLDALQLALQALIALLVGPDLLGELVAVRSVQLGDELRDEVLVLQRLLDGRQAWAMPLSLCRVCDLAMLRVGVGTLLELELALQALKVEVAQGIGAEAAGLEVLVRGDVRVLLEEVGDAAKHGGRHAIGMEALEEQQRLEVGVGRHASIHPPGVCSARAMSVLVGEDGSQGDEREQRRQPRRQRPQQQTQLLETDGHRMRHG